MQTCSMRVVRHISYAFRHWKMATSRQLQYPVTGAKTFPVFGPLEVIARKLVDGVSVEVGYRGANRGEAVAKPQAGPK